MRHRSHASLWNVWRSCVRVCISCHEKTTHAETNFTRMSTCQQAVIHNCDGLLLTVRNFLVAHRISTSHKSWHRIAIPIQHVALSRTTHFSKNVGSHHVFSLSFGQKLSWKPIASKHADFKKSLSHHEHCMPPAKVKMCVIMLVSLQRAIAVQRRRAKWEAMTQKSLWAWFHAWNIDFHCVRGVQSIKIDASRFSAQQRGRKKLQCERMFEHAFKRSFLRTFRKPNWLQSKIFWKQKNGWIQKTVAWNTKLICLKSSYAKNCVHEQLRHALMSMVLRVCAKLKDLRPFFWAPARKKKKIDFQTLKTSGLID